MIVVDFETTGLLIPGGTHEVQPGITQIGLAETDHLGAIYSYKVAYVDPEKPIEPGASKATGITAESLRLAGAQPLAVHLPEMAEMFRRHDTWLGYNCPFDKNVLWHQLTRYGWHQKFPWPTKEVDVMKIAGDVVNMPGRQGNKWPKLGELYKYLFQKELEGAHDAKVDITATNDCYVEIKRRGFV